MDTLKVISGGQTGADQAGVDAAKWHGFETGGWMPARWVTLAGCRPDFATKYGMQEHKNTGYPPRTKQNVFDADATIVLSEQMNSAGTKLTIQAARLFRKPLYTTQLNVAGEEKQVAQWLIDNSVHVLNVAGNSEQRCPGIYESVRTFMIKVFEEWKNLKAVNPSAL